MVLTVMKMHSYKRKPRTITYQKYKNFHSETFLTSLMPEVDKQRAFLYENGLEAFSKICTDVQEKLGRTSENLVSNHNTEKA